MIPDSPSGAAPAAAPESFKKPVVPLADVLQIDQGLLKEHVGEVVLKTVEDTLNGLLEVEADRLCKASRYEHSAERWTPLPAVTSASCTLGPAKSPSRC